MATTNAALELLQSTLTTLQSNLDGRVLEINKQFNEAKKLADKVYKEALNVAESTKNDALAEFNNEKNEINKIKNAIKALTGESTSKVKGVKTTGTKTANFTVPASYEAAITDNQKIYWVIAKADGITIPEILVKANELGNGYDTKKINNIVTALKKKFAVITENGKVGKAIKYSVV